MGLLELAETIGLNPKKVSGTSGGEYHSACPSCGGNDRFIMHPDKEMKNCVGDYWCRKCRINGDTIQFAREFHNLDFRAAVKAAQGVLPEMKNLKRIPTSRYASSAFTEVSYGKLVPPNRSWQSRAAAIIENAFHHLLEQPKILNDLEKRGLPIEAVMRYKFGYIHEDIWDNGSDWGQAVDKIWLPRGIIIPVWQKSTPVRFKIRRLDYNKEDGKPKFVIVPGGMNGLNIIGYITNRVVMVVESELDAYALHHALPNQFTFIAVGGSTKKPDNAAADISAQADLLFICHDNDEGGTKMLNGWQGWFSHAKATPTPIGKDIGEAIKLGLNIKEWIENLILNNVNTLSNSEVKIITTYDKNVENKNTSQNITATANNSAQEASEVECKSPEKLWGNDQAIVNWFMNERNLPLTPFTLTTKENGIEGVNDPESYYIVLRAAINGGPDTWEARTRRLQEILYLIKDLVDQNQ